MNRRMQTVILHVVLTVIGLVTIAPLAWMVGASFMPVGEAASYPPRFIPSRPTLEHYIALFTRLDIARNFMNSAFITITATIISVLVNATSNISPASPFSARIASAEKSQRGASC